MIPQFSGPFNPRPPLTTRFASVNGISPSTLCVAVTLIDAEGIGIDKASTAQLPSCICTPKQFWLIEITLTGVSILICANAFPEKTVLVTVNPLLVSGKLFAPVTIPACNFTATAGAIAFPFKLCAKTNTDALEAFAASVNTCVKTFASK